MRQRGYSLLMVLLGGAALCAMVGRACVPAAGMETKTEPRGGGADRISREEEDLT